MLRAVYTVHPSVQTVEPTAVKPIDKAFTRCNRSEQYNDHFFAIFIVHCVHILLATVTITSMAVN